MSMHSSEEQEGRPPHEQQEAAASSSSGGGSGSGSGSGSGGAPPDESSESPPAAAAAAAAGADNWSEFVQLVQLLEMAGRVRNGNGEGNGGGGNGNAGGGFPTGFRGPAVWLASRLGLSRQIPRRGGDGGGVTRETRGARPLRDRIGGSFRGFTGRPIDDDDDEDGEDDDDDDDYEIDETEDCLDDEDDSDDLDESTSSGGAGGGGVRGQRRRRSGDTIADRKVKPREDVEQQHQRGLRNHALGHLIRCRSAACEDSARFGKAKSGGDVNAYSMLVGRELNMSKTGRFSWAERCHVGSRFLPTDGPSIVDRQHSRAYTGQFSADGSFFVAGFQDQRIRVYNVDKGWVLRKDVLARNLSWTVTDTALSPDHRFLVYASITPLVHLVNVGSESAGVQSLANVTDIHEGLDFSAGSRQVHNFGIWSLQFSSDGRELVAGTNNKSIYVYDLEANEPTFRVMAHKDDVNAVAFADSSSHLIFSGSDDKNCKVWDRRCFAQKSKPVGLLEGHLEGITFIDSFGDGQHFISNSKDQTIKLWDIRKMASGPPSRSARRPKIPQLDWDYRWDYYPGRDRGLRHPNDQSLMTYGGHTVLKTLIRCYFSPQFSTGQKYIYTGSADGAVYIYDVVTGAQISRLKFHRTVVRDVSWHPTQPMLVSSAWDGHIAKWEPLHGETPSPSSGLWAGVSPHSLSRDTAYLDSD